MLEIKRQEVIELRELEIKHAAELVEIDRRLQQEQDDRKLRYDQQQADLKERFEERIREIGTELQAEYNLTKEQLDKIGNEYTKLYGQNGVVQRAIDYALIYLSAAYAQFAGGFGAFQSGQPIQPYTPPPIHYPGYATGATDMLVTSPKIIKVGEVPELVNITPLNRIGSAMGETGDKSGTITIELLLSPDLQARVMDSTLDQVANIMLDIQRRR